MENLQTPDDRKKLDGMYEVIMHTMVGWHLHSRTHTVYGHAHPLTPYSNVLKFLHPRPSMHSYVHAYAHSQT